MGGVSPEEELLAIRLRDARQRARLTQKELARAIGYGQTMVSAIETGRRGMRVNELARAAQILKVSVDYLIGITSPPNAPDVGPGAVARNLTAANFVPVYPESAKAGLSGTVKPPATQEPFAFNRARMERDGMDAAQCVVYEVHGDSMAPTLPDGCGILVDRLRRDLVDGRLYVVDAPGGLLVKRARWWPPNWWWHSDNRDPRFSPLLWEDSMMVVGEVRWAMTQFE